MLSWKFLRGTVVFMLSIDKDGLWLFPSHPSLVDESRNPATALVRSDDVQKSKKKHQQARGRSENI